MHHLRYILIILSLSLPLLGFGQRKTLDDLNREKAKLQSIIEQNNKMMEEYSSRRDNEMMRISMIDNNIEKRQALIETYNREIEAYNNQIRTLNFQIDSVSREVKKQKEEYANILRQLQVRGASYSPLAYILSSQSFNQSYRRFLFMRQYSTYRKEQFEKLNLSIEKLTKLKERVNDKLTEINRLKAQAKIEFAQLTSELSSRKANVEKIKQSQSNLEQQILAIETQKKSLDLQIEKVIKEEAERARREAEEARKKKEAEKAKNKGGKSDKKEPVSDDILDNKGNLPWPVRSYVVTSSFGEHDHPLVPSIKIRNNGVDMDILASKDIHPVHKGKVSCVIQIPGSTASVIVRHGEVLTVYSNLSEVYVKKDQQVDVFTNLGKVYTGSGINSNILHFELWKGDQKQNPEQWLKKQ